ISWVMQFHLSYVLLLPYVVASLYLQYVEFHAGTGRMAMRFLAGFLTMGIFLLPTVAWFGWNVGPGTALALIGFRPGNLVAHAESPFDILARFLSFASFEILPFVGPDSAARVAFVRQYPWMVPIVALLLAVGIAQPLAMVLIGVFGKLTNTPGWPAVRGICAATLGVLYLAFAFSPKRPHAHTFYVVLPVAMIFSLYCWNELLQRTKWQLCAGVLLVCGIVFHAVLGVYKQAHHPWRADRQAVAHALAEGNYRAFGERRAGAIY